MIWRTFLLFESKDYTQEGIDKFREFITDEELYLSFLEGRYRLLVALHQGQIIGAASVRNGNILSLLFVEEKFHRRGVGKRLLEMMCEHVAYEGGETKISLMASPYAVEFYRKQGFVAMGQEMRISGMRITPMEKICKAKGEEL